MSDPAVVRLVIAARVVAFEDHGKTALRELDLASEAFAELVPWDNEPKCDHCGDTGQHRYGLDAMDLEPCGCRADLGATHDES